MTTLRFQDLPKTQQFRIPNSLFGRLVIRVMRAYLGPQYTFVLRGRIVHVAKARRYLRTEFEKRLAQWLAAPQHESWQTKPTWRDLTDVQVRRQFARSIPWKIAREIGVYIVHTKQAAATMQQWRAQQYESDQTYNAARIERMVQERVAQWLKNHVGPSDLGTGAANRDAIAPATMPWGNRAMSEREVRPDVEPGLGAYIGQPATPPEPFTLHRFQVPLYEIEHDGDVQTYIRELHKVGVTVVHVGPINEDSECAVFTLDTKAKTMSHLLDLLTSAGVCA